MIYLCSADDTAGRQRIPAPPASLFLSLMLPCKGHPFPPERRNCSHTLRGVLQFRLLSAPQRYNTLDFPGKVVCQQGCCSPLLETQGKGDTLLWIPHHFLSNGTHMEKLRFPMSDHFFENVTAHALFFCWNIAKISSCAVM